MLSLHLVFLTTKETKLAGKETMEIERGWPISLDDNPSKDWALLVWREKPFLVKRIRCLGKTLVSREN